MRVGFEFNPKISNTQAKTSLKEVPKTQPMKMSKDQENEKSQRSSK